MKMAMGETMRRALLAALIAPILVASAAAQDFPSKTIRIVVGFPAGGPSDVPARSTTARSGPDR